MDDNWIETEPRSRSGRDLDPCINKKGRPVRLPFVLELFIEISVLFRVRWRRGIRGELKCQAKKYRLIE